MWFQSGRNVILFRWELDFHPGWNWDFIPTKSESECHQIPPQFCQKFNAFLLSPIGIWLHSGFDWNVSKFQTLCSANQSFQRWDFSSNFPSFWKKRENNRKSRATLSWLRAWWRFWIIFSFSEARTKYLSSPPLSTLCSIYNTHCGKTSILVKTSILIRKN